MKDINIIQYLPLTHPRATLRFIKKFDAAGVMSILDLEDSAQDPFDEEKPQTDVSDTDFTEEFEEEVTSDLPSMPDLD